MNKDTVSSKFVLMIATMLPAIMLAASLTLSLVPTTAFAQEEMQILTIKETFTKTREAITV